MFYKNVFMQVMKNKIFVVLLWILTILTSMSYFFVQCSIDGNMDIIQNKTVLQENEVLWENALKSNASLAYIFLVATTLLTCFVFCLFFYRFYRANKIQIGCVKALGMRDRELITCFLGFTVGMTVIGEIIGVMIGYFLSEILVQAHVESYFATEAVKGLHFSSLLIGCGVPLSAYVVITVVCFYMVKGKEPGVLLAGRVPYKKQGVAFHMADRIAGCIPAKEKFPFRIALRKPVAIVLMFFAVVFFEVCVILGESLHLSSQKVMQSQMIGHNYQYDTRMEKVTTEEYMQGAIPYLYRECEVFLSGKQETVSQTMIGLYADTMKTDTAILKLQNRKATCKDTPEAGTVYIHAGLEDMYGMHVGDEVVIKINGMQRVFEIADVLENAKSASLYCNADELAAWIGCEKGSYNGLWSMEAPGIGGTTESMEQRIERLDRDAVSNKISAVINQLTGIVIGVILLFLALFLNFQDNQKDMDILRLIGYQEHEIRKLFVDVYWPIVMVFFGVAILPSLFIAHTIQRGLSISIQDYMPFGTKLSVYVFMFLILNVIYGCVWMAFSGKVKKHN